jgi:hypothetical protein
MRLLNLFALLLVAGCSQQQPENTEATANEAAANATAEAATPVVPELDGEWQLTKIDGRTVDGGSIAAAFGGGKLRIIAGCTRRSWTFTQKRNIVAFAADPGGSANCESPPNGDQEAAIHALDRATMAIFTNEGREASLSGNGGNVTLERR